MASGSSNIVTVEEKYRIALSNGKNVNRLARELAHLETLSLLVKTGALTNLEEGQLRSKFRDDHKRFRRVVEIMLEKNKRECYVGFSRVVYFKNEHVGRKVFPFADELGKEHAPLVVRPPLLRPAPHPSRIISGPAAVQPDIMWMCATEDLYDLAREGTVSDFQGVRLTPCEKFKYQELEQPIQCGDGDTLDQIVHSPHTSYNGVWVMCPTRAEHLKDESMREFLRFFNNVKFFILSAECDPLDPLNPDAIVRVASSVLSGCGFIADLRHWTTLWQLRAEEECCWHCDRAPKDTDHPPVDFCVLKDDVDCVEASALYSAGPRVWRNGVIVFHAAILSDRRDGGCRTCGGHSALHSMQYTLKVIKHLYKNLPWTNRHKSHSRLVNDIEKHKLSL